MKGHISDLVRSLETDKRIDVKFIAGFLLFVTAARTTIETLAGAGDFLLFTHPENYVFVFSFYGFSLILYTFFISMCSGKKPSEVSRVLTPFLLVALIVPVLDYLIYGYPLGGYAMSKISDFDLLRISSNNPPGESVILWLIPILSSVYVFLKRGSLVRSAVSFLVVFMVPVFLARDIADFLGLGGVLFYLYASFGSAIFLLLLFYMNNSKKFGLVFQRFWERMNRIVLYMLVFIFGVSTSGSVLSVNLFGVYVLVLLMISFIAMCLDDYFGLETDRENRRGNLLLHLSRAEVRDMIFVSHLVLFPFLLFIFNSAGNVMFVYYMVSLLSLSFVYSYGNVLKRLFPLNYIADALSYSFVFMSGRSLNIVQGSMEFTYFALSFLIFLLLVPMKDFGDYAGDKKTGIRNLYTILGFERAFMVSKIFLATAFIIFSACLVYVMPVKGLVNILVFYVIPSVTIIPLIIFRFRKTKDFETGLWLVDILLLAYLVPFILF